MEPPCFTSLTKPWPCLPLLPVPTCTRHSAWARQMQGHRHRDLPGFLACRTQHSRRAGAAQDTLAQAFESIVSRRSSGRGSCTWSLRWGRWWSCSCQSHNPAPNLAWLTKCLRNSGGVQGRNGVLCTAGGPGGPSLFGMPAASSDLQEMTWSVQIRTVPPQDNALRNCKIRLVYKEACRAKYGLLVNQTIITHYYIIVPL